jgi:putative RNA 2'-phosphotransferase
MKESKRTRTSKYLSLVLRHRPDKIGLVLDEQGWVEVALLLAACADHKRSITREMLQEIVDTSPKKRFAFSEDGLKIRASQGHSVEVDLGYEAAAPPDALFHGTVAKVLPAIRADGLLKMNRHHVHLSPDKETASNVGSRRGKPIILAVRAVEMASAGHLFYVSANGVWLTETVPPKFIDFPE